MRLQTGQGGSEQGAEAGATLELHAPDYQRRQMKHNPPMNNELQSLTQALRDFAAERDWAQFHSPKNLASALAVEAAELLEPFQWLTEEQSRNLSVQKKAEVAAEAADVLLYLLQLCDKLDIDLMEAARKKLIVNGEKYPVDRAHGSSRKYTDI